MKKLILPAAFVAIFVLISAFLFYQHYLFRIQPPSEEWAKGMVISKGALKNSPKMISFGGDYIVAHEDGDRIKLIIIDKLGTKLLEKTVPMEDKFIKNINLLTDEKYIYLNWVVVKNSIDNMINLKMDREFNIVDRWEITDVGETIQVGENAMVIAYNNQIDFIDYLTQKSTSVQVRVPSKLAAAKTKDGYIVTFYQANYSWGTLRNYGFWCFKVKDGIATRPIIVHARKIGTRESVIGTAVACDNKFGYLIIDRTIASPGAPATYGHSLLVKFPLDGNAEYIPDDKFNPEFDNSGKATNLGNIQSEEKDLIILGRDEFTYSPIGVSSGDEARFLVGYTRQYGRSGRQFDIMDYSIKEGKIVKTTFMDKTREGTTMPWISGDMAIYCNQTSFGEYDVYLTSVEEGFKRLNNGPKPSEIRLAALDTVMDLANSIYGLFTVGIRWIIISMVLISIFSLFSYKLSIKSKRIVFLSICALTAFLKLYSIKSIVYSSGIYLPGILGSTAVGMLICIILSILSYGYGYLRFNKAYIKNPDVMPILSFIIAMVIDSMLTQYIYVPFIM